MKEQQDVEGTSREPLLKKEEKETKKEEQETTATPRDDGTTTANDGEGEATSLNPTSDATSESNTGSPGADESVSNGTPSAALLGLCTLGVVLVGLTLVAFVVFLPLWILLCYALISKTTIVHLSWQILLTAILGNLLHLGLLWVSPLYLCILRTLLLPIRRLIVPLVPRIAYIESIRAKEPTLYYKVPTTTTTTTIARPEFRKSVRARYRRMQKVYQQHRIKHVCVRADTKLCLRDVFPIIWEQQQRKMDSAAPVDEFIKRMLIVTVLPDGILDLYYDTTDDSDHQLVGFQFSILQGRVWHPFMHFCRASHCRAGIWWQGAYLGILRGHALAAAGNDDDDDDRQYYVNVQFHGEQTKKNAGYTAATHTQLDVLSQIYPEGWTMTRQVPESVMQVRLWDSPTSSDASEDAASH